MRNHRSFPNKSPFSPCHECHEPCKNEPQSCYRQSRSNNCTVLPSENFHSSPSTSNCTLTNSPGSVLHTLSVRLSICHPNYPTRKSDGQRINGQQSHQSYSAGDRPSSTPGWIAAGNVLYVTYAHPKMQSGWTVWFAGLDANLDIVQAHN